MKVSEIHSYNDLPRYSRHSELLSFFTAFPAIFVRFRSKSVTLGASLTASFPRTPKPCVVCSVVRPSGRSVRHFLAS